MLMLDLTTYYGMFVSTLRYLYIFSGSVSVYFVHLLSCTFTFYSSESDPVHSRTSYAGFNPI